MYLMKLGYWYQYPRNITVHAGYAKRLKQNEWDRYVWFFYKCD